MNLYIIIDNVMLCSLVWRYITGTEVMPMAFVWSVLCVLVLCTGETSECNEVAGSNDWKYITNQDCISSSVSFHDDVTTLYGCAVQYCVVICMFIQMNTAVVFINKSIACTPLSDGFARNSSHVLMQYIVECTNTVNYKFPVTHLISNTYESTYSTSIYSI